MKRTRRTGSNPDIPRQFTELSELRVLVVEDDEDDFMLLNFLLGEATDDSVEIDWVKSYAEALAMTAKQRHDIYLTDLRLGAHSGLELIARWLERGDPTPVVVLTGHGARSTHLDAFEAGARYCLDKARLDSRTLERAIRYSISHQHIQEASRQGEAWYRSLVDVLDASGVGAIIHDTAGEVAWVSRTVEQLFGVDAQEIAGCDSRQLLRSVIAPCFEAAQDFAIRAVSALDDLERVERCEYQMVEGRDGLGRWIEHRSKPVGEGPHSGGRVEIYTDVTARRSAQTVVAQSQARMRALSIHAEHTFALLGADHSFLFLSDSVESLLGYPAAELMGGDAFDLIHPDDQPRVGEVFAAVVAQPRQVYTVSFRCRHQNGAWRWMESKAESRLSDPAIEGVVVNTRDITEERAVVERARYAEELAAVDRIAERVALDLNTLLSTIAGQTQLLRDESTPGAPGEEVLAGIEDAIGRGAELVRQLLLAFGRRSSGGPEIFVLDQMVREMAWLVERVMRPDVTLQIEMSGADEWVAVDQRALELALLNLVLLLQGGISRGATMCFRTGSDGDGVGDPVSGDLPWIELSMPSAGLDETSNVLGPNCAWQTRILSLAGVEEMLRGAGASLHFEQHDGALSVRITLPRPPGTDAELGDLITDAATVHAAPEAATRESRLPESPPVVLIVEDDAHLRHVTQRLLARQGYLPLGTGSYADAVELSDEYDGPIHVVLSDIDLPDGNGRELVEHLISTRPDLRAVLMTGHHHEVEGDGPPLLKKPFTPPFLFETIRELLDQHP